MLQILKNLFDTEGFPPRWYCGRSWTPQLGWLTILSDIAIWAAYYAIPVVLVFFASRRKDVPFRPLFWLFGLFILACGTVHLVDAMIFWWPVYRLLAIIKFVTALASWGTVIAILPIIPQALRLRTPRQLEEEVTRRTEDLERANGALRRSEERLNLALAEQERTEQSLREVNRRKDEFLAMLAHELRNPLAPIRNGLALLARDGAGHEAVGLMQEQVGHLVRLVDDLLDTARIRRGKVALHVEPTAVQSAVQRSLESVSPQATARGQELAVSLPSASLWVRADPVRLAQIVTNLLNNAIKYTPDGGQIRIAAEQEEGQAKIVVQDNGMGIEAAFLPHVFELFTQGERSLDRAQGGLGIGLTLVQSLVEMHSGTVEARSQGPGTGCEFVVRLPLCPEPEHAEPLPVASAAAAPRRVLIVEDNPVAAKILAMLLANMGDHQIEVAHDGLAGLELAGTCRPEIVLLDIGLPGMNGYELAQRLRQEPGGDRLLIVALTGYGQEEDKLRSSAAGFDDHLLKPAAEAALQKLFSHPKLARLGE